jgi:hypothetical protein
LDGKRNLEDHIFYGNTIDNMERGGFCCTIACLLASPTSNIQDLFICNTIGLEKTCLVILGNALMGSKAKFFYFSGNYVISAKGWQKFSRILSCLTCIVRALCLCNMHLDSKVIQSLGEALTFNKALHYLDISENPSITAAGW